MSDKLVDAIENMREQEALGLARERLDRGEDPLKLLKLCRQAMETVGKRFEDGEYFLPELILAGSMLSRISEMAKPKIVSNLEIKRVGRVLMGTVEGDIHDIGKNIVTFLLDINGFEVLDIGVDAPPAKFVEAIRDFQPQVVGLSGLLTLAIESMKETVQAIKNAGLRDEVKIMIGGNQMSENVKEYAEADGYGEDAMAAVTLAKRWIGVK